MGFFAKLFETSWDREMRHTKEKLAAVEGKLTAIDKAYKKASLELDTIKDAQRKSERSEQTLRTLKQQLEVMAMSMRSDPSKTDVLVAL